MAGGDKRSFLENLNIFCLDDRLQSFKLAEWPHTSKSSSKVSSSFKITPETMSNAGFYARPIEGSVDNACCGYCRKNLDGWGKDDVAWEEHVAHSAVCPLVNLGELVNRELTFTLANWPHKGSIGPSKMAKAGFFFWPKVDDEEDDTAICVQCGLALDGWEPNDDPIHEHSRRRPKCPYLVTDMVHSPAHFELLLATKNTDGAMREWNESRKPTPAREVKTSLTKKRPAAEAKPKLLSPPKFKMPVSKSTASSIPVVSRTVKQQVVTSQTPKTTRNAMQAPTPTTTARRTSMRHAAKVSIDATPTFKVPAPVTDMKTSFSRQESVQPTPLAKRTRTTRQSSITVPAKREVNHLQEALNELRSGKKPLNITEADLKKPLKEFMQSLIGSRLQAFDAEVSKQLEAIQASVKA